MTAKTTYTPASVLKLADAIRKDISFRIATIRDEHGTDTSVSPRMLRYSLQDAHAACGGMNASAIAGAVIYLCCAYHNGSQSLAGLTAKPCKPWLAQTLRRQFEGLKSGGGCTPAELERSALALLDVIEEQVKPATVPSVQPEAPAPAPAPAYTMTDAAHNAQQGAIARKLRARSKTADSIRALRAEVRALRAQLEEMRTPKKHTPKKAIVA